LRPSCAEQGWQEGPEKHTTLRTELVEVFDRAGD
jgi:hypothetical protein